jgi:hypothetical protein
MFPIFRLPLLAVVDRRWLWATIALSAAAFINLHGVLTTPLSRPRMEHLPGGIPSTPGVIVAIALNIAGFVFVAWQIAEGSRGARSIPVACRGVGRRPADTLRPRRSHLCDDQRYRR